MFVPPPSCTLNSSSTGSSTLPAEIHHRRVEDYKLHINQRQAVEYSGHHCAVNYRTGHAPTLIDAENDSPWKSPLYSREEQDLLNGDLFPARIEVLQVFTNRAAPIEILGHLELLC